MRPLSTAVLAGLGLLWTAMATAAPLELAPADPQPKAAQLQAGLAVDYAYAIEGQDIKSLSDAASWLRSSARRGRPLKGLDYRDTNEGEPTLTSDKAFNVAARIRGYIRFDRPGVYDIDFLTNDGLRATIGGQQVGLFDGRQPCEGTYVVQVRVPNAGWYPLEAIYFQRLGTACLHMRWAPEGGDPRWVPDSAFAYEP